MSNSNNQFYLSSAQQDLLMAALSSNQNKTQQPVSAMAFAQQNRPRNGSSGSMSKSTDRNGTTSSNGQSAPPSGHLDFGPDDSPYLDFDLDGDVDDSFDFEGGEAMIGDIPESGDLHEKRKSIDGKDDDDEGGGKRRESEDKSGKKPGRKPLTSEPTTKRKAQNRAAQRAFRERKEKHLKDLETKVEDLEKASESTNHENGLLRAQVERLQVELKEYRKRLSWVSSNGMGRNSFAAATPSSAGNNSGNDFQFEFPKFGDLPATHIFNGSAASKPQDTNQGPSSATSSKPIWTSKPASQSISGAVHRSSTSSSSPRAPAPTHGSTGNSPMHTFTASPQAQSFSSPQKHNSVDSLTGLFSPSIIEAGRNASLDYFPQTNPNNASNQPSRNSADQLNTNSMRGLSNGSSGSNTDSPCSSSDSHQPSSSIGTSPEPSLNSPGNKLHEFGLNTISEENQLGTTFGDSSITPSYDAAGFNWLAQQNGGSFDPVLFGEYRDPQNAVVSQDFGTFFNEAFPLPDLGSPFHNFNDIAPTSPPKTDVLKEAESAQQGDEEVVPGENRGALMTCNKIWDRLQSMEKFRNGEIDVDNLCAELRSKARCSEGGAVVDEQEVNRILGGAK